MAKSQLNSTIRLSLILSRLFTLFLAFLTAEITQSVVNAINEYRFDEITYFHIFSKFLCVVDIVNSYDHDLLV